MERFIFIAKLAGVEIGAFVWEKEKAEGFTMAKIKWPFAQIISQKL